MIFGAMGLAQSTHSATQQALEVCRINSRRVPDAEFMLSYCRVWRAITDSTFRIRPVERTFGSCAILEIL